MLSGFPRDACASLICSPCRGAPGVRPDARSEKKAKKMWHHRKPLCRATHLLCVCQLLEQPAWLLLGRLGVGLGRGLGVLLGLAGLGVLFGLAALCALHFARALLPPFSLPSVSAALHRSRAPPHQKPNFSCRSQLFRHCFTRDIAVPVFQAGRHDASGNASLICSSVGRSTGVCDRWLINNDCPSAAMTKSPPSWSGSSSSSNSRSPRATRRT